MPLPHPVAALLCLGCLVVACRGHQETPEPQCLWAARPLKLKFADWNTEVSGCRRQALSTAPGADISRVQGKRVQWLSWEWPALKPQIASLKACPTRLGTACSEATASKPEGMPHRLVACSS